MWQVALLLLSRFSFSLSLESWIIMYLDMGHLQFILLWSLLCFLDVYNHIFHPIWEVFSPYFFKYSQPLSSLFSWDSTIHLLLCSMVHTDPLGSVHFSSFFFLSIPQTWKFPLSYLQVLWFLLLPAQIYQWIPLVYFFILVTVFSALEFFLNVMLMQQRKK